MRRPEGRRLPAATLHITQTDQEQVYLVAAGHQGLDSTSATTAAYEQLAQTLAERKLAIVQERVFGSLEAWPMISTVRERLFRSRGLNPEGPFTYVQGSPPWGEGLSGVIIRAVARGTPIWTIEHQGRPVGRGWRGPGHTCLILQNLQGIDPGDGRANLPSLQAQRLLEQAAAILEEQGASYRDTVRTWFYLNDILTWYREFNRERTAAYKKFGLLPGEMDNPFLLPASTGIGGEVPTAAAAALDLLAILGSRSSPPDIIPLSNPGQPDPHRYGSAFSRGILLRQPEISLIQVSGTAAIDPQGNSLYPHNLRAQIDCTLEKITLLISQAGASLADIAAACVFLKRPEDLQTYQERAAAWGIQDLPAVIMIADICRPELLMEMDAELAVTAAKL